MTRPDMTPSRASDLLLVVVSALAVVVLFPGDAATIALAILTAALIAWPVGVALWLARRWARAGDVRFAALALALIATAAGSALVAITFSG